MDLNEQQQAAKAQYDQQKARQAEITAMSLQVSESQQPTPTQEENDLAALGLMHPDDKVAVTAPEMPPVGAQQAYLSGADAAAPKILNPVTTTTTTAPRTTTTTTAPRTTGTVSSTGSTGA